MQRQVRVDSGGLQAIAARWGASVSDLDTTAAPAGRGWSCQASAAAVTAAHADVTAFTSALGARVGTRAANVVEADTRYIANEADAADHWESVGAHGYEVANQVWRDALSVDWQGESADALRTATHDDMLTTSAAADQLQTAAKVARSGASDLYAARSRVRYAVVVNQPLLRRRSIGSDPGRLAHHFAPPPYDFVPPRSRGCSPSSVSTREMSLGSKPPRRLGSSRSSPMRWHTDNTVRVWFPMSLSPVPP